MENNFLRVSVSPHIHSPVSTRSLMRDVCIAMLPALLFSFWLYGLHALWMTAVSVISCVGFEALSRLVMKRKQTVQDWSAVVTGILLVFCLPANLPLYMVVVGAFISIVVVKQFFGGIGMNFVNPALIGRIALSVSFAKEVADVAPLTQSAAAMAQRFGAVDAVASASPMNVMKGLVNAGTLDQLPQAGLISPLGAFLGFHTGSVGEVSILCLLLGFLYLLVRKVISWHIPVVYLATTAVLLFLFSGANFEYALLACLNGGLFLGAIFMATDYTTSPSTIKGKLLFGFGCGLLTAVIRFFGSMPEATAYSIVLMNLLVPYINGITRPLPFGVHKPTRVERRAAKEAAAK